MTARVYEFSDLLFHHPSEYREHWLKASILVDLLLFSGLSLVLKKQQFALGHIVHGCETHLL